MTKFFLFLLLVLIIVFFGLFVYLGFCYWKRSKAAKYIIVSILFVFLWSVYTAIYPNDSFFEHEFERVSGMDFPESGEIIIKNATYPDMQGDYFSCFVIKVNHQDHEMLNHKTKETESPIRFTCNKSKHFSVIRSGMVKEKFGDYYFWGITTSGLIVGNYWNN